MGETDQHFSAAQMAVLTERGMPLSGTPWRRIRLEIVRAISITDDPRLPIAAQRQPMCPVIDSDDRADLIVLPDGEQMWVSRDG